MALKITLEKSLIGRLEKQKKTASSLGLKKIGDVTVQEDSDAVKGKIEVIKHMVRVENA